MRIPTEILMERYRDNVFTAAFQICRNPDDADDVVQDTFLKYHTTAKEYETEQHIKAWLLRVAINRAKNLCLSFWRRSTVPLEDYLDTLEFQEPEHRELVEQVMAMPEKYRIVLHLYYFEEYSLKEIGSILKISEANARKRLSRGRDMLKQTEGI